MESNMHSVRMVATALAILASFAGSRVANATTTTVSSSSAFATATTGSVTTGFNGVAPLDAGAPTCPGSGACFAGFDALSVPGSSIVFSTTTPFRVNVNSALFYGANDLNMQYLVNSSPTPLTIKLPTAVTAFALDYGTLFSTSTVTFTLSNGFTTTFNPSLGDLKTAFIGFISTDLFDTITFSVPTDSSWVVEDVITASAAVSATPLPAALPLFVSGLAGLGFLARRKRKQAA